MIRTAYRSSTLFRGYRASRSPLIVALAFLALALTAPTAGAVIGWCKSDPVLAIDGKLADLIVSAPLTAPLTVTGPTQIKVTVPVGVRAALVLSDLGFGRGEVVSVSQSCTLSRTARGVDVLIEVYVPAADSTMPVRVDFAPRLLRLLRPDRIEGTANSWIVLRSTV